MGDRYLHLRAVALAFGANVSSVCALAVSAGCGCAPTGSDIFSQNKGAVPPTAWPPKTGPPAGAHLCRCLGKGASRRLCAQWRSTDFRQLLLSEGVTNWRPGAQVMRALLSLTHQLNGWARLLWHTA